MMEVMGWGTLLKGVTMILGFYTWYLMFNRSKKKPATGSFSGFRIIKTTNSVSGKEWWEIEFIDKAGVFVKGYYRRFNCASHSRESVIKVAGLELASLRPPEMIREEVYTSVMTDKDGGVSVVEPAE